MGQTGWIALTLLGSAGIGYLLGSINCSIIFTQAFQRRDIREQGSGNAGMTNVLRTVGKLPAALTFAGDFAKGAVSGLLAWLLMFLCCTWLGEGYYPELGCVARYVAGTACVIGHIFPVFYGLRGGKGVATAAAVILVCDWRVFLAVIFTFGVVFLAKRIISLASITCAAAYPVYTFVAVLLWGFGENFDVRYLVFALGMSAFLGGLVLYKHKSNIGRLIRGEEKPITAKKG